MKEIMDYFKKNTINKKEYLERLCEELDSRTKEYMNVKNKYTEVEESLMLNYIQQLEEEIEKLRSCLLS